MSKYFSIAVISARSHLAYVGEVASRVIFLGVILYIFLRLWQVTYGEMNAAKLGGLTLAQMLWYLCVTESITLSAPRIAQVVDEDVRTGTLAVQLTRPLFYPLYCLSTASGERLVRFALNLSVGAVITFVLIGPIEFSACGLMIFALSLPAAFVLDFLGNFLIGLGAFWLEDTGGLMLIYSRLGMILGGMLIPLELFPESIQPVLKVLPFSSIVYGPAHLFVHADLAELGFLLLRQGVAIVVLAFAVILIYRNALSRVYANGG